MEGLEYVKEQNGQGKFEQVMSVYWRNSFLERNGERSKHCSDERRYDELSSATESPRVGFSWMVRTCGSQEQGGTLEIMQLTLIPCTRVGRKN